jgi:hypothetical protein
MITIVRMGVIVHTTQSKIHEMRADDTGNSGDQKPGLIMDEKKLQDQ